MAKKFRSRAYLSLLLLFSLIQVVTPIAAQQPSPQRERRVTPAAVATPTPTPVPTIVPDEEPQASPTPTPDVVKTRTAATTRTLADLRTRISQVLDKPELAPAMVGIKVTSLQTGRVLFEENASKLLRPASNMKLYTVAAGLDRLSPDFRFVTSVYAPAKPDGNGVIKGDLTIYGRGDPSITARFNSGNYLKGIDD